MITIEVTNGELMATLTEQVAKHGISNGAIVSLIGAVNSFTVSTMPADDATKDIVTDYSLPAEMNGTGHLHRANIKTWFARAYVLPEK